VELRRMILHKPSRIARRIPPGRGKAFSGLRTRSSNTSERAQQQWELERRSRAF